MYEKLLKKPKDASVSTNCFWLSNSASFIKFLLWFNFICSQWTEEDEIADYKKNQEWMDECMDGMFEKWYDKIDEEETMEDRRKVHCSP